MNSFGGAEFWWWRSKARRWLAEEHQWTKKEFNIQNTRYNLFFSFFKNSRLNYHRRKIRENTAWKCILDRNFGCKKSCRDREKGLDSRRSEDRTAISWTRGRYFESVGFSLDEMFIARNKQIFRHWTKRDRFKPYFLCSKNIGDVAYQCRVKVNCHWPKYTVLYSMVQTTWGFLGSSIFARPPYLWTVHFHFWTIHEFSKNFNKGSGLKK